MARLGVSAALVAGQWVRGDVAIENGVLMAIGLSPAVGSHVVVSGFVEHQINGFAGVDFRDCDESGYVTAAEALLETGVTRFHPTFFSTSLEGYTDALGVLGQFHLRTPVGARAMGAHLEGPFLSPEWKGAHDAVHLLEPDPAVLDRLLAAGPVELMTLAPELPGAVELIPRLVAAGVWVGIGHTDADAALCRRAFDAGASMITHCYNAHRRFTSRDPGPMGAALSDGRVRIGLIADGVHVADEALRLVAAAAPDRMMLVTDAIATAGAGGHRRDESRHDDHRSDEHRWDNHGVNVTIADGAARLADGTLAGSVATMDSCVRKMITLGVPTEVVFRAAGGDRLRPGRPAEFAILDDRWEIVDALADIQGEGEVVRPD